MKKFSPMTVHHILPDAWGGNLRPNNVMNLKENVHQAVHTIFQDNTPIQRQRRLLEGDKKVLLPDVYLILSNTLQRFEGLMETESYEKDCFNIDKFLQRRKLLLGY